MITRPSHKSPLESALSTFFEKKRKRYPFHVSHSVSPSFRAEFLEKLWGSGATVYLYLAWKTRIMHGIYDAPSTYLSEKTPDERRVIIDEYDKLAASLKTGDPRYCSFKSARILPFNDM